jgi:3D (Asp-Asp-Asp) domain-containing protein
MKNEKFKFALYAAGSIVLAIGVVTIVNLAIAGVRKATAFISDPVGQWEVAAVTVPHGKRVSVAIYEEVSKTVREATAYNVGEPNQTDGSPCITADGTNACDELAQDEKICAANNLPLGTKLYVKGFGICTVKDRMNSRYESRIDLAMQVHEKERAVKFGLQNLEVSVLK